jgi:hypothetical protein
MKCRNKELYFSLSQINGEQYLFVLSTFVSQNEPW